MIHRDIKPANIYFDSATGVAKLLDFGIAGIKKPTRAGGKRKVGWSWRTPTYMAPEQIAGDPQDARCDLYALGVSFFTGCCRVGFRLMRPTSANRWRK